jgi:hypothetical protein
MLDPVVIVVPGGCDPYTDINFCEGSGGGSCISGVSPSLGDFDTLAGCGEPGGGGGGTKTPSRPPPTPTDEGPGTFAACIGALLVLAGTTATMQPLAEGVYTARNEYDSARRMYSAVQANNPSLEMELLYESRVAAARTNYDNAVQSYAVAAGASVLTVIGAVVVCSPGLILPTP